MKELSKFNIKLLEYIRGDSDKFRNISYLYLSLKKNSKKSL